MFAIGYPLDPTRKHAQSAKGIVAGFSMFAIGYPLDPTRKQRSRPRGSCFGSRDAEGQIVVIGLPALTQPLMPSGMIATLV
jgi:hypothetical protein